MKILKHHLLEAMTKAHKRLCKAAAGKSGPGWAEVWEVVGQMELVLKLAKPDDKAGD